ncbi:hypothetical protein M413DRAFT_415733 [Hebeloma cylindrosporum]|uniref:DUF6533 domain-containing protein n=1 Tax=Hebeloma cylindrosporum TaxID=76867 RepID=A0A0C3BSP0_HEBCY|nr:hypothetical protein M413DRAFT_415733 [Hebeloma cylindrosporum h7]
MLDSLDIAKYGLSDFYSAKQAIMDTRYSIIAMFFLQIYELFAVLQEEMRLIHRASWTSIKTLYLLCRYYPLMLWCAVIWAYVADHDVQTCSRVAQVVHIALAPCVCNRSVMLMRAYAFSGRNRNVLALLASCYTCLVLVDLWAFCRKVDMPPPILYAILGDTGCFPNYGEVYMALRIGYSMLAAILMDLVSLVVVAVYCVKSGWNRDVSLAHYFVSQGLTSFAFVSIINIATAITFFKPPRFHIGTGLPLIIVVSNIVACRLILQLREKVTPTESEISRRHSVLVRNALFSPSSDSWVIEGTER